MALITQPTYLLGGACIGAPGDVHASQKNALGLRRFGPAGQEYVYLTGVASTAVGSWVNFDEDFLTLLLDTDTVEAGQIAVACAAVDAATEFGWYQIVGQAEGLCLASFADDGIVFATSTAGSVDDADTGVGYIHGALGRGARDTGTGTALFQLCYPFNTGADLPN